MRKGRINRTERVAEKEVYLYRLNSNGIVEIQGGIFRFGLTRMLFRCENLTVEVSDEPGKLFRRFVWFDEPNLDKARVLFIEHEQNLIKQAQKKIETCNRMIDILTKLN